MTYPPEPWHLRGSMHLSLWQLPAAELPAAPVDPVLIGGRGLVGTTWVDYGPGSVLEYHELLSAVLVRHDGRLRVHITDIWVDSAASLRGGRELWGIPKESARFRFRGSAGDVGSSRAAGFAADGIASAGFTRNAALPGRIPFGYEIVQELAGRLLPSPVRGTTSADWCAAAWRFEPGGPLARLAGREPVASLALRDFRMDFGAAAGTRRDGDHWPPPGR